jgi:hypothetical protein
LLTSSAAIVPRSPVPRLISRAVTPRRASGSNMRPITAYGFIVR